MLRNAIAAALLLSASATVADEVPHAYFGLGVGQLTAEDESVDFKGDDTAFKVFGGYQVNQHLAVEGTFIHGGKASDDIFGVDVDLETRGFQTALLGSLPLGDAVTLNGRAGVMFWRSEISAFGESDSQSGNDLMYGIGLAFKAGETAKIRLDWEALEADGIDASLITLSAAFPFAAK